MRWQLSFSLLVLLLASQLSLAGERSAPEILWSQLAKLSELNGVMHGFGVSDSVEGNVVVVGAPHDGNSEQGQAYVFVRSGSNWGHMTQPATLAVSDALTGLKRIPIPTPPFSPALALPDNLQASNPNPRAIRRALPKSWMTILRRARLERWPFVLKAFLRGDGSSADFCAERLRRKATYPNGRRAAPRHI